MTRRTGVGTPPVVLRDCRPEDEDFLLRLYASTREDELAFTGWSPAVRDAFVRTQFDAQDRHYREHYAGCERSVVQVGGEPAGRFYVDRRPDRIIVVDISLLARFRGRGVGTLLLRGLTEEARARGVPVVLHVAIGNRAAALYSRIGFVATGCAGGYVSMEWVR